MTIYPYGNYDWRLDDYHEITKAEVYQQIQGLGYKRVKEYKKKAVLATTLNRPHRGLMCYDKCIHEELMELCRSRGLDSIQISSKPNADPREPYMIALEHQDDNQQFTKFLDLPAELRRTVYDFYMSDFGPKLRLPAQLPLGRTCHFLRNEVLPIFYGNVDFEFEIDLVQKREHKVSFFEEDKTSRFLSSLQPHNASRIRQLKYNIHRNDHWLNPNRTLDLERYICYICLDDTGHFAVQVEHTTGRAPASKWYVKHGTRIEQSMAEALAPLEMGDGRHQLSLTIIHGFRALIESLGRFDRE